MFDAKELLYVKKGGSDMTSFNYFRLFWRLAEKDEEVNRTITNLQ
jgi:hypothetical protein